MAVIIDGKAVAARVRDEAAREARALIEAGVTPSLTVILVGDDPASQVYVRNKARACKACGIRSEVVRLPADISQRDLMAEIARVNADKAIHGLLIQLPLPAHLDAAAATQAVDPRKDVDGFTYQNAGALLCGGEGFVPCTPAGCLELLKAYDVPLKGREAVVIGRSDIVGKPMALLLLREHCTVTVCHSRTRDLGDVVRRADIVIAAVGRPRLIGADMIREGAAVIDVGINRLDDGSLCGDVDFDPVSRRAGFITPVPGGVGPMTIAMLMKNTVKAAGLYGR